MLNLQSRTPALLSMGKGADVEVEEPDEEELNAEGATGAFAERMGAEGSEREVIDLVDED